MAVNWDYYDKFEGINDKYLPYKGEGATKAMQIVVAVNKLVYKYYNDGDVFDNTHYLKGWANDLSDYANWLYVHTDAGKILDKIVYCITNEDYEDLLKELADKLLNEESLEELNKVKKVESIYNCVGKFKYVEYPDDDYDDEEEYEDDEEEYED